VDDDPGIRGLLGKALVAPEFAVHTYADARSALAALPTVRPDLIVCDIAMPEMDGHAFLGEVRRMREMEDVAFVFLSAVQDDDEIMASFVSGADDFVTKPFHLMRFVAKVRATLRMVERRRPDTLTGDVSQAGTLPLLRYCEEMRLTGRLTVTLGDTARWADFLGGELSGAGARPEDGGEDALDGLLAMGAGAYVVEQRPLDAAALRASVERLLSGEVPAARPETPTIPPGRLSRVDVRGDTVEVQTEADNQPDFRVTTVVARGGQVLRKVESGWPHPLGRREDHALAQAQIERQHERVLAMLRGLASGGTPGASQRVDPSLLAWAVSFVADQVRRPLGSVMVAALLRRTHRATAAAHPALRRFRVAEEGRVAPDLAQPASSDVEIVSAAAAWTADFLAAAGEIVEKARGVPVRKVTRMLESELERCGYYAALDTALARR
jgi:CheY-like chemotaxis protein